MTIVRLTMRPHAANHNPSKHHLFSGFTLLEASVTTAVLGLLLAIAVPSFIRHRESTQCQLCIHNLNRIDVAKVTWAWHAGRDNDAEPNEEDLAPFFTDQVIPQCPAGGEYDLGPTSEPALCSLAHIGHYSEAGLAMYEFQPMGQVKQPVDPQKPHLATKLKLRPRKKPN